MRFEGSVVRFQGLDLGIQSYRDLLVWQRAMRLAAEAYRLGRLLPKAEEYRLTSIAEGHARGTRKDYAHFVSIARGSLAETETILLLLVDVDLLTSEQIEPALELSGETGRMLNGLLARLRSPLKPNPRNLTPET